MKIFVVNNRNEWIKKIHLPRKQKLKIIKNENNLWEKKKIQQKNFNFMTRQIKFHKNTPKNC